MKDVDAKWSVQALKLIREILSELPPDERAAAARELEPVVGQRQQPGKRRDT
jgi:hypothetical protein